MWITTPGRRRGSGRSRCRRAGRCGGTRAGACTTWTTTRAPPRGSGPTPSAWRASSTGAASVATWRRWRKATSASSTRTRSRRTRPTHRSSPPACLTPTKNSTLAVCRSIPTHNAHPSLFHHLSFIDACAYIM